jgi:hypothetical protein
MTGLKDRANIKRDFVPQLHYTPKAVTAKHLLELKRACWVQFFAKDFPSYHVYSCWLWRNKLDGQNVLAIKETMQNQFGDGEDKL